MQPGLSVCHIGSGADVVRYENAIANHFDITSPTLQAATGGAGAWAQILASNVGRLVADNPVRGISPHVHIQICSLGEFFEGDNSTTRVWPDGRRVEFRMPQIASTYREFKALCTSIGKGAAGAIA
jgi:hypothetical protein